MLECVDDFYLIGTENIMGNALIMNIQNELIGMKDEKYRDFHSRLIPDVDKEKIIGVRMPALRKYAKNIEGSKSAAEFIDVLPHVYYEEDNLHMLLISEIQDYDECLKRVEDFIPYINNWATCDMPAPKSFKKHKEVLIYEIKKWIKSTHTYTVRYAIGMLMKLYLDEDYKPEYIRTVADIKSEEYYVNMMIAWYMATALAKQWDDAIVYIRERKLPDWIHKKTISKARESYRITGEQKKYLKELM